MHTIGVHPGGLEPARHPVHFIPVILGLIGHHDGETARVLPGPVTEQRGKPVDHAVGPADERITQRAVGGGQRARHPDAAGHGIQLRDRHARLGRNHVGPDHVRDRLPKPFHASILQQGRRLALVEILVHPKRLFALDAVQIQPVERFGERPELGAEVLEERHVLCGQLERNGRDAPCGR